MIHPIIFCLGFLVPLTFASEKDLYDSCMKYKPNEKYCKCISEELYKSTGVSKETKLRLEKKFTVNMNDALGQSKGSTTPHPEFEPLLCPYTTCLNREIGKEMKSCK